MDWVLHDSHDSFYRSPFGAVPCKTDIILRLRIFCREELDAVRLHFWKNNVLSEVKMQPAKEADSSRVYEVEFNAGDGPGLIWYYFFIVKEGRPYYYGNNPQRLGGQGVIQETVPFSYQITVYHQDFKVPSWFGKTVMYQIFVDRFYQGTDKVLQPRKGALLHADWDDTPLYVREPDSHAIRRWTFFGGNLEGIIKKLPYLKELGIGVIYLNPVFEASSNHKYDTGDYLKIDPMYGTNETFRALCEEAAKHQIRIILDGVFSHTGSDSVYFNKYGTYSSLGAYQSQDSPYYKWYRFSAYPDKYESWWGIDTLPNVEELEPSYEEFIINGENSVVKYWIRLGAKGWRLDVADELPDPFIKKLRKAQKEQDPESILIGEVWEDASNKISYGQTRSFLWGEELDSVMNYPFRRILLDYLLGKKDARQAHRHLFSLYENYPRAGFYSAMNLVGSHDVARILTLLGEGMSGEQLTESAKEIERLSPQKRALGIARLKLLSLIQFTFPGVPCIYYGDEAGLEGYSDPYNRGTYPWGREDQELLDWYKKIISLRNTYPALYEGEWLPLYARQDVYSFLRVKNTEMIAVCANRNVNSEVGVLLDLRRWGKGFWQDLLNQDLKYQVKDDLTEIILPPLSGLVLLKK